jgi:glycogen debranching enzyme
MYGDSEAAEVLDSVRKRAIVVKDLMDKVFYDKGFYIDRVSGEGRVGVETVNALIPLICGFRDHSGSVLREIESRRFTTDVGVRTRADGESGYMPWGYHTGMVWSLTTAWMAAAEFACGRPERGWKYLKMLMDDLDEDALGCVSECWNGESLQLGGCSLQLWGSGFIPRLVDEFMLGIRVDAAKGIIHVSPRLPKKVSQVEREVFIGKKSVRLSFTRKSVKCSDRSVKVAKE